MTTHDDLPWGEPTPSAPDAPEANAGPGPQIPEDPEPEDVAVPGGRGRDIGRLVWAEVITSDKLTAGVVDGVAGLFENKPTFRLLDNQPDHFETMADAKRWLRAKTEDGTVGAGTYRPVRVHDNVVVTVEMKRQVSFSW